MPSKIFIAFILSILVHITVVAQLVLKPFPQHVTYVQGVIKPSNISQQYMDDSVTSYYEKWKERYINNAGEDQYYVWVEGSVETNECVSEGQGYGMIIMALMAGYDKESQKIYDGLYRYFKAHPSKRSPYLMAWAQTETLEDVDGSSAADGDIDIAYSLLLANAQWGSNGAINYLQEAQLAIEALKEQEINTETYSVLLSNAVVPQSGDYYDTRCSDFMPAHFKAFGKATHDNFWNKVADTNYDLFKFLQHQYSPAAGLVPDFVEHVNKNLGAARPNYLESKYDGAYNYNACRVPWRIATDFIINGDGRSKQFVEKINKWLRKKTGNNPANICAGYTLEGDALANRNFEAMSFIASFSVGAMVDFNNQEWLNKLWDYIFNFDIDQFDYYGNTIKMITLIILSGNYWAP